MQEDSLFAAAHEWVYSPGQFLDRAKIFSYILLFNPLRRAGVYASHRFRGTYVRKINLHKSKLQG